MDLREARQYFFARHPLTIRCSVCKTATALIGKDFDENYTMDFYRGQGWDFSKYKTMCPECRQKENERIETLESLRRIEQEGR